MDVRIGIIQSPKELEVELKDDADHDKIVAEIEKLLKTGDGVLWLTDRRGARVGACSCALTYPTPFPHKGQGCPGKRIRLQYFTFCNPKTSCPALCRASAPRSHRHQSLFAAAPRADECSAFALGWPGQARPRRREVLFHLDSLAYGTF